MISLSLASPVPINDQIKSGLRGLVARGLLKPGDPAPSVRGLAAALKVNPNTVARALRELALEGFIESRRGEIGTIAARAPERAAAGVDAALRRLRESVLQGRRGGLTWRQVLDAVREVRRREK